MSEPTRLRDRPELPDTRRDALRSLEEQVPAAKTVARIQQELEALPSSPALLPHAGAKLVLKLAALSIGATIALRAVWMWQHERTRSRAHAPVAVDATPDSLRERPHEASEAAMTGAPARPVQPILAKELTPSDVGEPSAAGVAALASEESHQRALAPQPDLVTHPDTEPSGVARTAARSAEPEGADSEASVLYRAKRLEVRDPAAALRLLEGHARDFPNGAFVEERYALSIRILERLGQAQRAAQLRRAFQARFPSSVYQTTRTP